MGKRGNNEGAIYKRKDGRWEAKVTVGYGLDGKPIRKSSYHTVRRKHDAQGMVGALVSKQTGRASFVNLGKLRPYAENHLAGIGPFQVEEHQAFAGSHPWRERLFVYQPHRRFDDAAKHLSVALPKGAGSGWRQVFTAALLLSYLCHASFCCRCKPEDNSGADGIESLQPKKETGIA